MIALGDSIRFTHPQSRLLLGFLRLQKSLLLQVCDNLPHCFLHARLFAMNVDFGILGCFIRSTDTGELLDLAGTGLLVEALGVALLRDLKGHVDVDLDEGDGLVAGVGALGVQGAGEVTVGPVGRDEGGDGDGGRVGEELRNL